LSATNFHACGETTADDGSRRKLKLKALEIRQSNLVKPSKSLNRTTEAIESTTTLETTVGSATPPEDLLNFWREDPLTNEHHEHWHLVYPLRPINFPSGTKPNDGYKLGDRHGELFAYMHQQMLARYDAERLGLGLPRVEAFDVHPLTDKGFTAPIPQGYDPGDLKLWDGEQWYLFRERTAGASLSDLAVKESGFEWTSQRPGAKITDQVRFGNALFSAAMSNKYSLLQPESNVTIDNLGDTVEANVNSEDYYGNSNQNNYKLYGNFHNDGHIHFMFFDNQIPSGVMGVTSAAIRDPIFFRWHKLIDDIYFSYQETLPTYDFSQTDKAETTAKVPATT
jgi:tyrosinase